MENVIVIAILVAILGAAVCYVYKAKKRGQKCIGCPDGGNCSGNCSGCAGNCSCGHTEK